MHNNNFVTGSSADTNYRLNAIGFTADDLLPLDTLRIRQPDRRASDSIQGRQRHCGSREERRLPNREISGSTSQVPHASSNRHPLKPLFRGTPPVLNGDEKRSRRQVRRSHLSFNEAAPSSFSSGARYHLHRGDDCLGYEPRTSFPSGEHCHWDCNRRLRIRTRRRVERRDFLNDDSRTRRGCTATRPMTTHAE